MYNFLYFLLTHWGRVTHICISKLTIIGSDNGLSPGWRQAIIWTNAGILLIGPLGTNFNGTSNEIHTFSFKKIHLKLSSGKWRPFCLGLNVSMFSYIQLKDYHSTHINILAPGRRDSDIKSVISKHMLQIKFMGCSCEIVLRRIAENIFDKSTSVAW